MILGGPPCASGFYGPVNNYNFIKKKIIFIIFNIKKLSYCYCIIKKFQEKLKKIRLFDIYQK